MGCAGCVEAQTFAAKLRFGSEKHFQLGSADTCRAELQAQPLGCPWLMIPDEHSQGRCDPCSWILQLTPRFACWCFRSLGFSAAFPRKLQGTRPGLSSFLPWIFLCGQVWFPLIPGGVGLFRGIRWMRCDSPGELICVKLFSLFCVLSLLLLLGSVKFCAVCSSRKL